MINHSIQFKAEARHTEHTAPLPQHACCNHEAPKASRHRPAAQGPRLPPRATRVGATSSAGPSRGRSAATRSTATRSSASASACCGSSRTAGTPLATYAYRSLPCSLLAAPRARPHTPLLSYRAPILVATDVAARGLDIKLVMMVSRCDSNLFPDPNSNPNPDPNSNPDQLPLQP